ncbi:MAG: hypothetical protein SFX73_34485 [Kofleriaceae bacterium]|nr:hypothetical protein [Kofleriaceae bacterium]
MKTVTCCVAVLLAARPAAADQASIHANGGLEVLVGPDATSAGFRFHAGYGRSFGAGRVQPTLSLGGTFGASVLGPDRPGALDDKTSLWLVAAGPELTLALRFADGGWVDNRVFVSGAWMYIDVDDEVQALAIPGLEGGHAMRFGAGVSWAGSIARAMVGANPKSEAAFLWLAPQQLELVFERSGGFERYGAVVAWGI